jgi:hypothetical protein
LGLSYVLLLFMVSAADIAREQDEGLALLYQRGLELALKIQDDAMAAETADERAKLGAAFHRISRGVRQTAALRVKLAGDAVRCEREATADVVRLETARVAKRKAQVKATVERLIWSETETQERDDHLCDILQTFLDEDELHGHLAEGDVDNHIARICREIGLPSPLAGEGVGPGPAPGTTDEGSHGDRHSPSPAEPDNPAQPLIRAAGAASGLLPQGEKGRPLPDHPWRSSA